MELYRIKPKNGSQRIGNRVYTQGAIYSVDYDTAKIAERSKGFEVLDKLPKKKPTPAPEERECHCGPFESCDICEKPVAKQPDAPADTAPDTAAADTASEAAGSGAGSSDQPEEGTVPKDYVDGLQTYDALLVKDAPAYLAKLTNLDFVKFLAENAAKTGSREAAASRLAELQG